jgi:hypothetical protein
MPEVSMEHNLELQGQEYRSDKLTTHRPPHSQLRVLILIGSGFLICFIPDFRVSCFAPKIGRTCRN